MSGGSDSDLGDTLALARFGRQQQQRRRLEDALRSDSSSSGSESDLATGSDSPDGSSGSDIVRDAGGSVVRAGAEPLASSDLSDEAGESDGDVGKVMGSRTEGAQRRTLDALRASTAAIRRRLADLLAAAQQI
jgi:hypothetical protein